LPTLARMAPTGSEWVHEITHDGFRFICRRDGDRIRVFSRNGRDWTDRVPLIAEAIGKLRVRSVTIDGEGVACRLDGVSDFDRLRSAVGRMGSRDAFLYVFDLLEINGTDLRRDAWDERRKILARLLQRASKGIRLSEHLNDNGSIAFQQACKLGLEGIVSKRREPALSLWTVGRLDQGQEPKRTGSHEANRRVIQQ
jgi:bifunctional non-homologous end joining protein LigD